MNLFKIIVCASALVLGMSIIPSFATDVKIEKLSLINYFPEKDIRKILAQSKVSEDKWPEIIHSLEIKIEALVEDLGLREMTAHLNSKGSKRTEKKIKKALYKHFNTSEEKLKKLELKIRNNKDLKKFIDENSSKLSKSDELQEVKPSIEKLKTNVDEIQDILHSLILRLLKEELELLSQ